MPANLDYPELAAARQQWRYQPAPDCLAGKVILITGAGDGIGRAAARSYAAFGADVVLLGRTRTKLEAVSDWITEHTDTSPVIVPCDLEALDTVSADALADAIDAEFGKLDGLLHNASLLGPKVGLQYFPLDDWQRVLRVNVTAPFLLTKALLPALLGAPLASVIMTSSSVGRQGRAYWGAYAVSKFALEGFMQVLADELEHTNTVRVNSLNPGGTRTAMRAAAYPGENPADVPAPEERMDVYLYLMEDGSRALTSQALDARHWTGPETSD